MKAKQIDRQTDTRAVKAAAIPAFAYARVSSKEQEREGYSIPVQLKRVHEYAERHGFQIVEEFVDVETAKEPGRREFSRMVEAARHDSTLGAIICEKVDRLCRNLRDYLTIDELPAKTLFWQQDFPDNAAGKLSFGMMVLLAKHYIDNLSDEVKKGMAEKVQEGGFPHQAPLGYRNAREGDRQIIVPDAVKASMVSARVRTLRHTSLLAQDAPQEDARGRDGHHETRQAHQSQPAGMAVEESLLLRRLPLEGPHLGWEPSSAGLA